MKKLSLVLICLIGFIAFGQQPIPKSIPDTLVVKSFAYANNTGTFIDKNIAWIIALGLGILTVVVNILTSRYLRKSNSDITKMQLQNSKEITLSQLKASIATKNRQDWINEIRKQTSELISHAFRLMMETKNNSVSIDILNDHLQNLIFCQSQIQMHLNSNKKEQDDLIKSIDKLVVFIAYIKEKPKDTFHKEFHELKDQIIDDAQKLFGIHWKKIKSETYNLDNQ